MQYGFQFLPLNLRLSCAFRLLSESQIPRTLSLMPECWILQVLRPLKKKCKLFRLFAMATNRSDFLTDLKQPCSFWAICAWSSRFPSRRSNSEIEALTKRLLLKLRLYCNFRANGFSHANALPCWVNRVAEYILIPRKLTWTWPIFWGAEICLRTSPGTVAEYAETGSVKPIKMVMKLIKDFPGMVSAFFVRALSRYAEGSSLDHPRLYGSLWKGQNDYRIFCGVWSGLMTINSMINAPVFKIQGTIAYRNASAFKASGD